jgi:hypothetical protein
MPTEFENLKPGTIYSVSRVKAVGSPTLMGTGTYKKTTNGEAEFDTGRKDEKGKPIYEVYDNRFRFKDITAAGHGFRAVTALRALTGRGRRTRTRKHKRRARKTRRSRK